ncbi:MAG: hypothetical protein Kow0037_28590 [Calditrichia bacterium]
MVLLVLVGLVPVTQHNKARPAPLAEAVSPLDPLVMVQVNEIAEKFRCSCGQCGGFPLEECSCPTAKEEKSFIAQQIKQGVAAHEIINQLSQTYGWIEDDTGEPVNKK